MFFCYDYENNLELKSSVPVIPRTDFEINSSDIKATFILHRYSLEPNQSVTDRPPFYTSPAEPVRF